MKAFKKSIKETHGANKYAKEYLKWIKGIENYIKLTK